MRKTGYHMHTRRCMHALGRDEECVMGAIRNGYEEIGFSDHSPWDYGSDFVASTRMPLSKFDGCYASVSPLKERYKNHISTKISLECKYFPKYIDWLKQFLIDKRPSYITFGNHYFRVDEECVYFGAACEGEARLIVYVDEAITGMKTNLYSYLCHPNLFIWGRRVFDGVVKHELIRLRQVAKGLHIPLEYNLASVAYSDIMYTMQYPHIDFWKTATEVGNTAITGVDAREPAALETDSYRKEGIVLLSDLGMKIADTLPLKDFTSYK